MSTTLPNIRARVLATCNALDARRPIGVVLVDNVIRNQYFLLHSHLPPAYVQSDSAGTLSAATFTLPTTSSAEYAGEIRIRLRSTGRFLRHVSMEEIDAMRNGSPTTATGVPSHFALYEEDDQEVQGRLNRTPDQSYTYDLFRGLVPADFDLTAVDSTNIRFSRYGILALILASAAELVAQMTPEDLALRRLNPRVAEKWNQESRVILHKEAIRRHEIDSTGRVQRWEA